MWTALPITLTGEQRAELTRRVAAHMYDTTTSKGRRTYRINFVLIPSLMIVFGAVGVVVNALRLLS